MSSRYCPEEVRPIRCRSYPACWNSFRSLDIYAWTLPLAFFGSSSPHSRSATLAELTPCPTSRSRMASTNWSLARPAGSNVPSCRSSTGPRSIRNRTSVPPRVCENAPSWACCTPEIRRTPGGLALKRFFGGIRSGCAEGDEGDLAVEGSGPAHKARRSRRDGEILPPRNRRMTHTGRACQIVLGDARVGVP